MTGHLGAQVVLALPEVSARLGPFWWAVHPLQSMEYIRGFSWILTWMESFTLSISPTYPFFFSFMDRGLGVISNNKSLLSRKS